VSNPGNNAERDAIHAVAADWFVRLRQRDLSLEDTLAWQKWMMLDTRHSDAFHRIEGLWQMMDSVNPPDSPTPAVLAADLYDGSVPVSNWNYRRRTGPATSSRPRTFRLAALVCAVALLCIGGMIVQGLLPRISGATVIETAIGMNRTVRLEDGSVVEIGGHTKLSVSMRPELRELRLVRGEAFFTVAKDPTRPFLVRAGSATVTAVGTEFNVRRSDDRVVVSVVEGRVMVQPMAPLVPISWIPASSPVGNAAPLGAGQRTTVDRAGLESTVALADTSSVTEWQKGQLAFESEPLRYAVQDVNRYATRPIVIADEQTAQLLVTGTVTNNNIMGWVTSLHAAFGIRVDVRPDQIVLSRN